MYLAIIILSLLGFIVSCFFGRKMEVSKAYIIICITVIVIQKNFPLCLISICNSINYHRLEHFYILKECSLIFGLSISSFCTILLQLLNNFYAFSYSDFVSICSLFTQCHTYLIILLLLFRLFNFMSFSFTLLC